MNEHNVHVKKQKQQEDEREGLLNIMRQLSMTI